MWDAIGAGAVADAFAGPVGGEQLLEREGLAGASMRRPRAWTIRCRDPPAAVDVRGPQRDARVVARVKGRGH